MKKLIVGIGALVLIVTAVGGCNKTQNLAKDQESEKARYETLVIPDGTNVVATLDQRLTTEKNQSGDSFAMTTIEPIIIDGRTAFPTGASINGVLNDVQASGRASGRAQMTLSYVRITDSDGKDHQISAAPLALRAESATGTDVERIAAGGILGAIVGGIAGGGKGAAIGAGAGAGAGAIVMLATQGDEVVLEAGQKVSVRMTSPLNIQVLALK